MSIVLKGLHSAYLSSLWPSWRRFHTSSRNPQLAQSSTLKRILKSNTNTVFGRKHSFDSIDSLRGFRSKVPICSFEDISHFVEMAADGRKSVLTRDPVLLFEKTSGSTSANKLIPFTQGLLDEIAAATHPWLFDLMLKCPRLLGKRSYWAISPATRKKETTAARIPIGIDDDTEYFGVIGRLVLGKMMAVPSRVGRIQDVDCWRWETCKHLLEARDLGLISVWSPTFLTRLMEYVNENLEDLLQSIKPNRAIEIARLIDRNGGRLLGELIWPNLSLVSCWADGPASRFLTRLKEFFPDTIFQPKGLLATEGVISFPLWGIEGSVLAVSGHFLEFIDIENADRPPLLVHELQEGVRVSPLLTTSGGLYRYHLKDILCCVGKYNSTPCVRFEGRLDSACDLVGEKLSEPLVEAAIAKALEEAGIDCPFAMMAPCLNNPPTYHLYVECSLTTEQSFLIQKKVEGALLESAHYAYCRKIGQLGPVSIVPISNGLEGLERRRIAEGGRIGELKPCALDRRDGWEEFF